MAAMAQTTKVTGIRISVALRLYCMEVVMFTVNTYQSFSDDVIIASKECVCTNCSTRKAFLEKVESIQ